jgi:5-methylcytosine-specific restriction protein A
MPNRRPLHRANGMQTAADRRRAYFRLRPGRTIARGYDWHWKQLRKAYLAQHELCECGCGYIAAVVDHKIPHNGDAALFRDWNNLQALAKPCHDKKTAARDGGFGNPIKPTGPVIYTVENGADVWPRLRRK